jgi:hypothetical protein
MQADPDLFWSMKRICDTNDIKLVIIHSAYRATRAHECILTGFCEARQVLMFEAIDALHRADTHRLKICSSTQPTLRRWATSTWSTVYCRSCRRDSENDPIFNSF